MKRYCLTLNLKNDPQLIAEYKRRPEKIWPEITKSIKDAGIKNMEIYLLGTRLFMIIDALEIASFDAKAEADPLHQLAIHTVRFCVFCIALAPPAAS